MPQQIRECLNRQLQTAFSSNQNASLDTPVFFPSNESTDCCSSRETYTAEDGLVEHLYVRAVLDTGCWNAEGRSTSFSYDEVTVAEVTTQCLYHLLAMNRKRREDEQPRGSLVSRSPFCLSQSCTASRSVLVPCKSEVSLRCLTRVLPGPRCVS